jgi:hypothetical protein
MKKSLFIFLLLPLVASAKVEVNLLEDKNYNDLEISKISSSQSKEDFKRIVEKYLNKHLKKIDKADYDVSITFKEVDMAGRMDIGHSMARMAGKIRKVNDMDFVRLEFSYVISKGQTTVKSGEEVLKDVGTMRSVKERTRRDSDTLYFEIRLLKDWLDGALAS